MKVFFPQGRWNSSERRTVAGRFAFALMLLALVLGAGGLVRWAWTARDEIGPGPAMARGAATARALGFDEERGTGGAGAGLSGWSSTTSAGEDQDAEAGELELEAETEIEQEIRAGGALAFHREETSRFGGASASAGEGGLERLLAAWERIERRLAAAAEQARESVVALEYTASEAPADTRRIATGVVINIQGEVLSIRIDRPSSRATASASAIVARDYRGRRHAARWIAADPETGLTLLRVAPRALRPIRLASVGPVLGGQVFVVGSPYGMDHSISRGHVAALDRMLDLDAGQLGGLIQIQAPLYPGDSGAAVVGPRGRWLGLIRGGLAVRRSDEEENIGENENQSVNENEDENQNIEATLSEKGRGRARAVRGGGPSRARPDTDFGFAIPSRDALWVAEQLRAHGRVERAYLGVRLGPPDSAPASTSTSTSASASNSGPDAPVEIERDGVRVRDVLSGSPAARAGLRAGDRIVAIDGRPVPARRDLIDRLGRTPARRTIRLRVERGEGEDAAVIEIALVTASRPAQAPAPSATPVAPPSPPRAPASNASAPARPTRPSTRVAGPASASTSTSTSRSNSNSVQASAVAPAHPPALDELPMALPRAVIDRIERLERRLEKLEASARTQTQAAPEHEGAPVAAAHAP